MSPAGGFSGISGGKGSLADSSQRKSLRIMGALLPARAGRKPASALPAL
jgi:hypothetical protein